MQVFTTFGFVHKITTFEKTAGFQVNSPSSVLVGLLQPLKISSFDNISFVQALVQFSDAETATSAKDALDGRIIPR